MIVIPRDNHVVLTGLEDMLSELLTGGALSRKLFQGAAFPVEGRIKGLRSHCSIQTLLVIAKSGVSGIFFSELKSPATNDFIIDIDSGFSQQFFDISITHRKPKGEPNGLFDNILSEPIAVK